MKLVVRILRLTVLLALATSPTAAAQGNKPADTKSAVIDRVEVGLVWTGERKKADGSTERIVTASDPALIKKELAEIQVLIDVDRNLDGARKQLDDLHIRATRLGPGWDYWNTLRDVAIARAKLYEMLGDPAQALASTSAILVTSKEAKAAPEYVFAAPSETALSQSRAAQDDSRLKELRERLTKKAAPNGDASSTDKIAQIVQEALRTGGQNQIGELGPRALPELERLCTAAFDDMPPTANDALTYIVQIGGPEAARFVLENFDRGGFLWKRRIQRALVTNLVFERTSDWSFTADERQPPQLNVPEWLPIVSRLLLDPVSQRIALDVMKPLVRLDALTPELQVGVKSALGSSDASTARDFAVLLHANTGRRSVLAVLEAGLQSSNVEARGIVALALVGYKKSDALLRAANDPSPRVRQAVASGLLPRTMRTPRYSNKDQINYSQDDVTAEIGAREIAILTALIADPDADVRASAGMAIARQPTQLADDVYLRMARDPDSRVRESLSYCGVDEPLFLKLAELRASETNAQILQRFDSSLLTMAKERGGAQRDADKYLEVLQIRRHNTAVPLSGFNNEPQVVQAIAMASSLALTRLAIAAVEPDGEDLFPGVVQALRQRTLNHEPVSNPKDVGIDVDRDTLAKLFLLANTKLDGRFISDTQWALMALQLDWSASLLPVAEDPQRPPHVRLRALQLTAAHGGERAVNVLLALASGTDSMHWNPGDVRTTLNSIGRSFPEPFRTEALTRLVADTKCADNFVGWFGETVVTNSKPSTALSDAILARFLDSADNYALNLVAAALREVAARPRAAQLDWLMRATKVRREETVQVAFQLLGEKHDPADLPFLTECLIPKDSSAAGTRNGRNLALEALTRYLDDDAAEVILRAAGTANDPEFRKRCFDALDTIRKFQEERHRWDARKTSQQAKDDAVHELVKMLDDADPAVRAQSVRSLGTLGAVEQLPRFVRLLKDRDEGVRKAAQDALDLLNAPGPKKD